MSENRRLDYLSHMMEAAQLICSYIEGMDQADFAADKRTQQAVILNLIVIGEASAKILNEAIDFTNRHPEIPLEKHERYAQSDCTRLLRY
jgi:uncharacterized protein with HEPN domain